MFRNEVPAAGSGRGCLKHSDRGTFVMLIRRGLGGTYSPRSSTIGICYKATSPTRIDWDRRTLLWGPILASTCPPQTRVGEKLYGFPCHRFPPEVQEILERCCEVGWVGPLCWPFLDLKADVGDCCSGKC